MISPKFTLEDFFGHDLILNPRASHSGFGWLPKNQMLLDYLTGAPLTIAGSMPFVCNKCTVTADILALMEKADLAIEPVKYVYKNQQDFKSLLTQFTQENKKLVFTHLHPPTEVDPKAYWLNPKLIAYLNNKASLEKLVPPGHTPKRKLIYPQELAKLAKASPLPFKLPCVVKAATDGPTGGGHDVVICHNRQDVYQALSQFGPYTTIIVEEYLEIVQNYCVQFAKRTSGQINYLGTAEQLTDPSGRYLGNWISTTETPPLVRELGRSIMQSASELGYIGIGGFDIVVSKEGKVLVIDLNFRINGSTAPLLLYESIVRKHNSSTILFTSWKPRVTWQKFIAITREAIESLKFVPLNIYDSSSSLYPDATPLLSGILMGSSKEEVLQKEKYLTKEF